MKKKLIAMLLSAAMCLSLAACGQKADTPDTTDPAEPSGDAATYTVGICQLVQHEALDAATQGFIDALNEALPGQVKIEEKNASGDSNSCATIVNGFVSEGVDLIMANATAALQAAGASGGISWDVVQLQASRSQPILDMHRMAAQNPVWIVTASKR